MTNTLPLSVYDIAMHGEMCYPNGVKLYELTENILKAVLGMYEDFKLALLQA